MMLLSSPNRNVLSGSTSAGAGASRSLLPEIWLKIFDFATFVPGAFDTAPQDLFAYPMPLSQDEIHYVLRRTVVTKRNLVLVCKSWHEMATPLLYQAISMTEWVTLPLLLQTFSPSINGSGEVSTRPELTERRFLTRRLDFTVPDEEEPGVIYGMMPLLGLLLMLMENLEILVVRHKNYTRSLFDVDMESLFPILEVQGFENLRVLDIRSKLVMPVFPVRIPRRVSEKPRLRILRIQPLDLTVGAESGTIFAPSLQVLHVPARAARDILEMETLPPSVTHLAIGINSSVGRFIHDHEANLGSFGTSLTTLEVCHLLDPPGYEFFLPRIRFELTIRIVVGACPALRNLIVGLREVVGTSLFRFYFPPVENIGIRFLSNYNEFSKSSLCGGSRPAGGRLKAIRVLSQPTCDQLAAESPEVLEKFKEAASDLLTFCGARFEDVDGNAFHSGLEYN